MTPAKQSRLEADPEATGKCLAGTTSVRHFLSDEQVENLLAHAWIAIVETDFGRPRRRPFLTMAAAEAAVRNARSRGHRAEVILCELMPVSGGGDAR